jgi:hypothetical protein
MPALLTGEVLSDSTHETRPGGADGASWQAGCTHTRTRTLRAGYSEGCAGAATSQMHSSPSAPPEAMRLGLKLLNSSPCTCARVHRQQGQPRCMWQGGQHHARGSRETALTGTHTAQQRHARPPTNPHHTHNPPRRCASASLTAAGWRRCPRSGVLGSTGRCCRPPGRPQ